MTESRPMVGGEWVIGKMETEQGKQRCLRFRVTLLWLAIVLMGSFWLTVRGTSDIVSLVVMPQVPRENEPVIATFKLNNPYPQDVVTTYQFYANGELVNEGTTTIARGSSKTYKYAYENPLKLGEQVNFLVRVKSEQGSYEKFLSTPAYPPQIWSSFSSFAAFSTSVFSSVSAVSSLSTMTYYQATFGRSQSLGLDVGLITTVVLTLLLVFLELSLPAIRRKTIGVLGKLRIRFSTVTWILFIIFLGMVYTRVVLIITG